MLVFYEIVFRSEAILFERNMCDYTENMDVIIRNDQKGGLFH